MGGLGRGVRERDGASESDARLFLAPELLQQRALDPEEIEVVGKLARERLDHRQRGVGAIHLGHGDRAIQPDHRGWLDFQAISAGPHHEFNDAISLVVLCDDQAELDRYWNALLEDGGKPQACGWLIDRFGVRWQIVPAKLDELMSGEDPARSKKVTDALLKMIKLDIATLEKAYRS